MNANYGNCNCELCLASKGRTPRDKARDIRGFAILVAVVSALAVICLYWSWL